MQLMVTDLTRRSLFKAALLGLSAHCLPAWAIPNATLKPALIGCSIEGRNRYSAVVADRIGNKISALPIPERGHGVAINSDKELAVVFARRPGSFFQAFNYKTGHTYPLKVAEKYRHFYGHGAFSNDGKLLYATQGDNNSLGIIGVYDVENDFQKVDEFSEFGIGPHEVIVLEDDTLVIGVGGVQTEGRVPTNLDSMNPSLSYLDKSGQLIEQVGLEDNKLSIRHLSAHNREFVVCGQQYRGEPDDYPSLIGLHRRGEAITLLKAEPEQWARFNHYIASIAVVDDYLLATSPRGNCYGIWSISKNQLLEISFLPDASGVVVFDDDFLISSGSGKVVSRTAKKINSNQTFGIQWDNHWSAI